MTAAAMHFHQELLNTALWPLPSKARDRVSKGSYSSRAPLLRIMLIRVVTQRCEKRPEPSEFSRALANATAVRVKSGLHPPQIFKNSALINSQDPKELTLSQPRAQARQNDAAGA
jgi:hypothetical protein